MAAVHPGMPMNFGGRVAGQPMPGQPFPQYAPQPVPSQTQAYKQSPAMQPQQPQPQQQAARPQQVPSAAQLAPTASASRTLPMAAPPAAPMPQQQAPPPARTAREQQLERRVAELEAAVAERDQEAQELQQRLATAEGRAGASSWKGPGVNVNRGFRKLSGALPAAKYAAVDRNDPVDVQLEEFYNSTGSAIPFKRINRGFYRFGSTIVELSIVNQKLVATTEDGWNRGKCAPIAKFMNRYENPERQLAGIAPEVN